MKFPFADLSGSIKKIRKPWSPVELLDFDNYHAYIAKFSGEYKWHQHDFDELFYVYEGEIEVQIKGESSIRLKKGQMAVVKKGVEHCPKSKKGAFVMMVEKAGNN